MHSKIYISLNGGDISRFIYACQKSGIRITQISAPGDFSFVCTYKDFAMICRNIRKYGCKMRITGKKGGIFLLRACLRRWTLWVSMLVCLIVVYTLTLFVWEIEIVGPYENGTAVIGALKNSGLGTGTFKRSVNSRQLTNSFLLNMPDVKWMTCEFDGCRAIVTLYPQEEKQDFPDAYTPCDLISDKTGIVTATRIRSGVSEVKKGQTVMKGDRIASGTVVSTQGDVTLVASYGEIELRTWHTLNAVMPISQYSRQSSEIIGKEVHLQVGSRGFRLFPVETEEFSCYDKYVIKKSFEKLPFSLQYREYCLPVYEDPLKDAEKCAEYMKKTMEQMFCEENPKAKVLRTVFTFIEEEGAIKGKLLVECLETAGVPAPIR